jgi:hypothetical protein
VAVAHPTHGNERMGGGPGWHFTEWALGIVGGIGLFLGLFTLFASDESSIGLGGDWTWQVGEITTVWKYTFVVGGATLVLIAVTMAVMGRKRVRPAGRIDAELSNLIWHAGIFLAVNAFIWLQDIALGGGIDYALYTTIPWGIGLAVHAIAYTRSRRAPA